MWLSAKFHYSELSVYGKFYYSELSASTLSGKFYYPLFSQSIIPWLNTSLVGLIHKYIIGRTWPSISTLGLQLPQQTLAHFGSSNSDMFCMWPCSLFAADLLWSNRDFNCVNHTFVTGNYNIQTNLVKIFISQKDSL